MTFEEIINHLDELEKFDVESPENRQALREAIALLRTHQNAQPNEPLTLAELWEMDGQPIYAVDRVYPPNSGWWILGWTGADFVLAAAKRRGTQYIVQNYGTDWVAYRRPPKEAK